MHVWCYYKYCTNHATRYLRDIKHNVQKPVCDDHAKHRIIQQALLTGQIIALTRHEFEVAEVMSS